MLYSARQLGILGSRTEAKNDKEFITASYVILEQLKKSGASLTGIIV
jgi:hypothetical protein